MSSLAALVLAAAQAAAGTDAEALLSRAERVKEAWPEVLLTLSVTADKSGGAPSAVKLQVAAKGGDRACIRFLDPADSGKLFVMKGGDAWLILPTAKNPIRVPKSQRLNGGFAVADISRTRFADDYDAVVERTEVLDGRECSVLRLTARKGRNPPYPVVRVWVDGKEGLYRKATFLVASGKMAKDVTFDAYRTFQGALGIGKMTILDTLRPGRTVVEYLEYRKATLPDALFDPGTAREAAAKLPAP